MPWSEMSSKIWSSNPLRDIELAQAKNNNNKKPHAHKEVHSSHVTFWNNEMSPRILPDHLPRICIGSSLRHLRVQVPFNLSAFGERFLPSPGAERNS